ncbi:MAG: efflux RND transporter periplasmic adaptor subunit [Gemmatimonadaceae bacterium]|nr:efflux RND transporter periplasmic adaptor subunit [Gemmatimonadaceae bacterium]
MSAPVVPFATTRLRSVSFMASAALLAVSAAACAKGDGANAASDAATTTAAAPIPVEVATVQSGNTAQAVTATGSYVSRDEIPLSFKIGGVIARVAVDQGATVQRGQLLASLDLREIDAMVNKARVGVDKAERDAARAARLAVDSVATSVQSADAASALDAAKADYETARVNREYAIITAPESGVVLQRMASAGTTIGAGLPVFVLGGNTRGRVMRVGLADRDALRVRVGDRATVTFDAQPETTYQGVVTLIGQASDPRTGTYTVEVRLTNAPAQLPNGLVGRVVITTRSSVSGLQIPVDALVEAHVDSATVFTVTDAAAGASARAQRVRIVQMMGDRVIVTGVSEGARVVTRGAPYLIDGARITMAASGKAAGSSKP